MLFALMLAGLVLSTSIPKAFESQGRWRSPAPTCSCRSAAACSCCGRCRAHSPGNYRNFQRITAWLAACRPCSGSPARSPRRSAARAVGWRLWLSNTSRRRSASGRPGSAARPRPTGTSRAATWPSAAALFIIIALGESILVTGAKFAELPWTRGDVAAFLVAFVGSVAMWWIYFNIGAERASRRIAHSQRSGPAGAAGLYLPASAAGRRHHRRGGRRRARARASDRPYRRQDRRRAARRRRALSARQPAVQAATTANGRRCRIWWAWCCWLLWPRVARVARSL